jgi:tryptophan synthase alpha chain
VPAPAPAVPAPSTGRIAAAFARARAERRKSLVIYLTAGDPDLETSRRLIEAAIAAGADIIEVGVPWSDPSADGPVIAAAMRRALRSGGGLRASLDLCRAVRSTFADVPLVLFGYANPIVVRGTARFAAEARAAGADAVLCVDWPPDENGPSDGHPGAEGASSSLISDLRAEGLDFIALIAPTSTPERVRLAADRASGFLYYVSLTGITGRSLDEFDGPRRSVDEIRRLTGDRLPIAVGFGISTPEQARQVAGFSDAVVVGSAAVRVIERTIADGRDPVPPLGAFVASLRAALG